MRGEDLIVVLGRQETRGLKCNRLLRAHHEGVGEATQEHHQRQQHIHDADALVVDARDPLAPEVGDVTLEGNPDQDRAERGKNGPAGDEGYRLVQRNGLQTELTPHGRGTPSRSWWSPWPASGPALAVARRGRSHRTIQAGRRGRYRGLRFRSAAEDSGKPSGRASARRNAPLPPSA